MFLQLWSAIESRLLTLARARVERVFSVIEAIRVLEQFEVLPIDLSKRLNTVRQTRNMAVHNPEKLKAGQLVTSSDELRSLADALKDISVSSLHP